MSARIYLFGILFGHGHPTPTIAMFETTSLLDAGLVVVDVVDSSFVMEWNRNNEERAIEVGMLVVEVSHGWDI